MSLKFLNLDQLDVENPYIRKLNGLNVEDAYTYLLFNSKLLFSERHIVFTNFKSVFIMNQEEWKEILQLDAKYVRYLGADKETINNIISKLEYDEMFSLEIISEIYGGLPNINIVTDIQDDVYLLNHYLKKANRLLLKDLYADIEFRQTLDPNNIILSLVETELDMEVITLIPPTGHRLKWAYMNIRKDVAGFIYPVINILDFQEYALSGKQRYQRYLIPVEVLKQLLKENLPRTIEVSSEDLMWSNQICAHCHFNLAADNHKTICQLFRMEVK